jgi:hypothetical protein
LLVFVGVVVVFVVGVGEVAQPAACGDMDLIPAKTLEGVEYNFATPRTEPHVYPCTLKGRKDAVVAWHGGLWVLDWKTASDWGEDLSRNTHLLEGRMSFQFRGYAWAERARQAAIGLDPDIISTSTLGVRDSLPLLGTIAVYLVSRRPYATDRKQAKPMPRNQFHLECYPYDSRQLDEWRGEFLGLCGDVLRDHATGGWRRKRTGCGHWGRCEFYDYCEACPGDREALLATSAFQPKLIERDL